ncbi:hypothetical protein ABZ942_36345 [Nocardia sp. NPDC046473]|uniref:hypothetical protein n=1 Tax=Nocardia sp. NPDC046473 TaxID=3155733 RepID=UPI0033E0F334
MTAAGLATLTAHLFNVEDLMNRPMLNIVAAGAISLAIALQPAIAAAAPALPQEPTPTAPVTAPFDPICPLCFIREFLESGSAHP